MASNGRLNISELATINNGKKVAAKVAPYFNLMNSAFKARFDKPIYVNWGYRTYAEQVAMRKKHGTGAAIPGTSNHGLGLSLDLWSGISVAGSPEHKWMKANAGKYGFVDDVAREPWHWTFKKTPTVSLNNPGNVENNFPKPTTPKPATPDLGDTDMIFMKDPKGGYYILDSFGEQNIGGLKDTGVSNAEVINAAHAAGKVLTPNARDSDVLRMIARRRGAANAAAVAAKVPKPTAAPAPTVDVAAISKALTPALVAAVKSAAPGAAPAEIAAAVDKVLLDNFAAIPKAVNDDQAKRLQS